MSLICGLHSYLCFPELLSFLLCVGVTKIRCQTFYGKRDASLPTFSIVITGNEFQEVAISQLYTILHT